jgi:hypothetical protein
MGGLFFCVSIHKNLKFEIFLSGGLTGTDAEGGTDVSIQMIFETAAERDKIVAEYGAEKGLSENLDRLQEHLASL